MDLTDEESPHDHVERMTEKRTQTSDNILTPWPHTDGHKCSHKQSAKHGQKERGEKPATKQQFGTNKTAI